MEYLSKVLFTRLKAVT